MTRVVFFSALLKLVSFSTPFTALGVLSSFTLYLIQYNSILVCLALCLCMCWEGGREISTHGDFLSIHAVESMKHPPSNLINSQFWFYFFLLKFFQGEWDKVVDFHFQRWISERGARRTGS